MADIFGNGFDLGAAISKAFGNKAADVYPGLDNVKINPQMDSNFNITPFGTPRGTSAYAPGGSKFVNAPVPTVNDTTGTTDTSNNLNVGGGGGSTLPSSAQTSPLLASLASLDTILTNKNQGTQDEYGRAIDSYNTTDAIDKANYDQNTAQNETSLTGNNQKALLNAANASTGLRGVLASLHALGGSGMDIVKKLVGLASNSDTGAARNMFDTNAQSLTQAYGRAEQEQKQRRLDATALRDNNLQNNQADVLTSRQGIFQQLANLFGAGTSQGNDYAAQAGALAAPIAATTRSSVAPYAKGSSLFTPGALKSYLGGTQNLNVATNNGDMPTINSPVYTQKKDQLSGVA